MIAQTISMINFGQSKTASVEKSPKPNTGELDCVFTMADCKRATANTTHRAATK